MKWFDEGKASIINRIAAKTGVSPSAIRDVYTELDNEGLLDYDVEKEIFWDEFYGKEEG